MMECSGVFRFKFRRSILSLLGILFLVLLACPERSSAAEKKPSASIQVTAAVPRHFPPHYLVDRQGRPAGFAIEVMDRVAARAGLRVTYLVLDSWDEVLDAIRSGRADLIPNLGITEERAKFADFTSSVEAFGVSLFVREETTDVKSLLDLRGRVAGAVEANVAVRLLGEQPQMRLRVFPTPSEAVFALLSGQIDAVAYPVPPMRRLLEGAELEGRIRVAGKPLIEVKRAIAVRKGQEALLNRLNLALIGFLETKEFRRIYIKWHGAPKPPERWPAEQVWMLGGAALGWILLVILGMGVWRYHSVSKLNRQLMESVAAIEGRDKELLRTNRALRMLSGSNQTLVRARNEKELLEEICRICVVVGGHLLAWIGFAEDDAEMTVRPVASYGKTDYLDAVKISWSEGSQLGTGPAGRAIRERIPFTARDIPSEPYISPWREEAGKRGFASSVSIPLLDRGEAFGCLNIYSGETDAFRPDETAILFEMANDVAYGIRSLRAAEALRESEARTRSIVDNAYDGIVTIDEKGIVESMNPAALMLFGYSADEVLGKNVNLLMPEPHAGLHDTYIANYLRTGEGKIIGIGREVPARRKDGTIVPVDLTVSEFFLEGRRKFLGSLRDLSEQKRAEETLQQSADEMRNLIVRLRMAGEIANIVASKLEPEELFRTIVQEIRRTVPCERCLIGTLDPETRRRVYWHVESDVEVGPEAIESREMGDWIYQNVYEKKRPANIKDLETGGTPDAPILLAAGLRSVLFIPILQDDLCLAHLVLGSRRAGWFSAEDEERLMSVGGHLGTAIRNAELHGEARRSRDFFQSVVQESADAIIISDPDRTIIQWNRAAEELYGYSAPEMLGQKIDLIIPPGEDRGPIRRKIFASEETVHEETERLRKDGSLVPVGLTLSPVRGEGGKIVALAAFHRDLTEAKRAEAERETHRQRMVRLHGLAQKISATLKLDEILEYVVESAAELLDVPYAELFLLEDGSLRSKFVHSESISPQGLEKMEAGKGLASVIFASGHALYVKEVLKDPRWLSVEWARREGIGSYLGVPLRHGEDILGVLVCLVRGVREFSGDEIRLMESFANGAAAGLRNAQLHDEAQRSRDFFESVVTNSVDAITTVDREGKILLWNQAAEKLFGYTEAEVLGKKPEEFLIPKERSAEKEQMLAEVFESRPVRFDSYRRRKDGALVPVNVSISPVRDVEGKVIARSAVFRDLTQRLKNEEEARRRENLLRVQNEALISLSKSPAIGQGDIESSVREVSEVSSRTLNVERVGVWLFEEGYSKIQCVNLYERSLDRHSGGQEVPMAFIPPYFLATEEETRAIAVHNVSVDPRTRELTESYCGPLGITSMLDAPIRVAGRTIGMLRHEHVGPPRQWMAEEQTFAASLADLVAISMEAHQRKQAEEKLRQSQTLLVRAEKLSSIGTLTAGAAHEILNPANIIGLHAQRLLWESEEESPVHASAEVIQRNVERISRICDDLRRFSRDEKPMFEVFDPDEVFRQCIRPLESELRLGSIQVERKFPEEPITIEGDKNQIQQVFFNLLRNAMEAMPKGGTLTVESAEVDLEDRKWWELRVTDTGEGIPEEILPKIFDPFFTTKPEDMGTGLGLSVSYGIVEAHGGKIWAESEAGMGSTFFVRLPMAEDAEEEE